VLADTVQFMGMWDAAMDVMLAWAVIEMNIPGFTAET
jgi:hypothetical protein